MTPSLLYGLAGLTLFVMGLHAALLATPVLHRLLGINLMGSGVFTLLIAIAYREDAAGAVVTDPVPHALVLTGIVVAVSATALALKLICRAHELASEQRGDGV